MGAGASMNSGTLLSPPQAAGGESGELPAGVSRFPAWTGIALVLALTFAVYIPTLRYQFVHDDRGQIVENPAVHTWHAVPSYFTSQVWAGVKPDDLGNYYRPLFLLWLRVNDVAFGNRAWGWHLTTILAHLFTTLLVYLLARRLAGDRDVGLLAALIFGLHPAHIEAVAWISGVTEPLLGILLIGSFLCYLRWRGDPTRKWQFLSLLLFVFAMLEKETALILPGLVIAYEWIFRAEPGREALAPAREPALETGHDRSLEPTVDLSPALVPRPPSPLGRGLETASSQASPSGRGVQPHLPSRGILEFCRTALERTWPYFVLIALYVPARIYALKGFNHVVAPLSTGQLVSTWPGLIWFWIRHLVWPAGLSTFYNFPAVLQPTLRNCFLPAIFDACVAIVLVLLVRRSRPAAFFAAWLVLPLIPLLNIRVFIANDFAHDRYLYLPSVGLAVLGAMLLKRACPGQPRWLGVPATLLGAAVCLAAVMSYGTMTQSGYFRDNLTFYAYNLSRAPHNPDAESNYATVLAEDHLYGPALEKFLDVINHYPSYWTPTYNLALTYYKMGKLAEAEQYFLQAIRIKPNNADEYFYLGLTRFKSGRTAEGIACERQAIAIRSNGFVYHFALGMMLKTRGDLAGALQEFKQELAVNPGEPAAVAQIKEIEGRMQTPPARGR
jgi:Tfp pilus assembly protein PilF